MRDYRETSFSSLGESGREDASGRFGGSPWPQAAAGSDATTPQLLEMRRMIREHIANSALEVVVIVEAIDPHSSNTFQARHSYTAADIEFDHSFMPCMSVASDGQALLNWESFHKLKEAPFNTTNIIGGAHA